MEDMTLEVRTGTIESFSGRLSFSFVVRTGGDAHVQIYGSDPTNLRKSGVLLCLNSVRYDELKEAIRKTDEVIDKLRVGGQFKGQLTLPWG